MKLERSARCIRDRAGEVVPGLLQSPLYARTIYRRADRGAPDQRIEALVSARTDRLRHLREGTALCCVIDETILRRPIGSVDVMIDQLEHLQRLCSDPLIQVNIVPYDAPGRPVVQGAFRVMTLDAGRQVAHVDHCLGESVVSRLEDVQQCLTWFGELQSEALPPGASLDLIDRIRRELSDG
ncbi:DUF5753 domain-containing protein [Streptomonospora nanhaiensis]|uniref:DUF5753 domain-containing protein n=1 Tax=Streptomonospora nanhaiensis TaxID=1323731 RepID=UPI0027DF991A|nr:DUF5753 domain-containing protein [Streptomonospora nanhaiensis]